MSSLFILGCICTFIYLWSKRRSKARLPLPPGPPTDPLLGHLRRIPTENQDTVFNEWGKIYGDVIHLHFLGRSIIVLNSVQAAVDLLEKRGLNYSDRPRFTVLELLGFSRYILGYGKQFQRYRQNIHGHFAENKCLAYHPIQTRETRVLLKNILLDENNWDYFLNRYSAAVIMRIVYGYQITSNDDPFTQISEDVARAVGSSGPPGGTIVDFFPFLQYFPSWFPGTYYVNYARENRSTIAKLYDNPFDYVQKEMAEGTAKPSFLLHHLEALNNAGGNYPDTADDIKGAAGMLYLGATDTIASSLSLFLLAMTLYPECQVIAQKEIDAVVGQGRLPELSDRKSLPYIDCIVQETLRWHNATPLGTPHYSREDDVYRGMLIPKNSMIIANTRAMTLDEKIYTNPHRYNPSRFLPRPEGNEEPYPRGPFGFGRRICPGRYLTEASLWIAMASILATFNISKAVGTDGKEITPEIGFTCGIVSHPRPFQCRIRPRNEVTKRLIIEADTPDGYTA